MDYAYLLTSLSLVGFLLGLIFPIGKISRKTTVYLLSLVALAYFITVCVSAYSLYTQPLTKLDYSNPLTLVIVATLGSFFYFWQGIISYGGGVLANYFIFFVKKHFYK